MYMILNSCSAAQVNLDIAEILSAVPDARIGYHVDAAQHLQEAVVFARNAYQNSLRG